MTKRKLRMMYRRYLFSYNFEVFTPKAWEYAPPPKPVHKVN